MLNKIKVIGLVLSFFLIGCKEIKENNPYQRIENFFTKEGVLELKNDGKSIKKIDIEFAISEFETEEGLKDRYSMKENQGMLFVFDKADPKSFWMKDTRIPLDIIYVRADSVVLNIARNAPVMTERGITPSSGNAKYVLEVNGGMSDKWGIIEGKTKLNWKNNNK